MTQTRTRHCATYHCEYPDGRPEIVHEYQTELQHRPISGPARWIGGGSKELQTSAGDPVNWISDEIFEHVLTGTRMKVLR